MNEAHTIQPASQLVAARSGGYRADMSTDDPSDEPLGFNINIGDILKGATAPKRRTRRATTGVSGAMDSVVRQAIRTEMKDVEKALRDLATEVVRLRRANEDLAARVAKLQRP